VDVINTFLQEHVSKIKVEFTLINFSKYPSGNSFLYDVLDLSHFLDIADGINFVVHAFEARAFLNPVLQLRLVREYGIRKWIEPAMRSMMEWLGPTFTKQNAMDIGFDMFYHITITKFQLEEMLEGYGVQPTYFGEGFRLSSAHSMQGSLGGPMVEWSCLAHSSSELDQVRRAD
jgi:hypothetical protein